MMILGLTGGPGTGKTLAAKYLEEKGAVIVSGDQAGKKVLDKYPSTLKKLTNVFGPSILRTDGSLDRRKLGRLVFRDKRAMRKLNSIVHPHLLKILRSRIRELKQRGRRKMIVVDAALIFEWGIEDWFDHILVITSRRDNRIQRMVAAGLTKREASYRIASQIPQYIKASRADTVIRNNGTRRELKSRISGLFNTLVK